MDDGRGEKRGGVGIGRNPNNGPNWVKWAKGRRMEERERVVQCSSGGGRGGGGGGGKREERGLLAPLARGEKDGPSSSFPLSVVCLKSKRKYSIRLLVRRGKGG